jgi:hypothetical protein
LFQISQVLHKNLTRLKDNYFQKRERRANLAGQHLKLQNGEVCTQRQKKKKKKKKEQQLDFVRIYMIFLKFVGC